MAVREPAWFEPEHFCRQVLHFSFRKLGLILAESEEDLNCFPEEFKEAVETVGRAVITLQLIIRERLRPIFIESINLISYASSLERNEAICREIAQFMAQGYLRKDIIKATLTCFAIVAELHIFLLDFNCPIPAYWYPMPWCAIYEHQLRRKLESNGGWERLLKEARTNYTDSRFYEETILSYLNNNPIPHAEKSDILNLPIDERNFLTARFGVAPRSTTLAMEILKKIYFKKDDRVIPFPGAGAYVMRLMLGLENPWIHPGFGVASQF